MKHKQNGFTIVELVVVIAVIAILAAVMIPTFASVIENSRDSTALQRAKNALEIVTAEEIGLKNVRYSFSFTQTGEEYIYIYDNTDSGSRKLEKGEALTGDTVSITNEDLTKINVTVCREKAFGES